MTIGDLLEKIRDLEKREKEIEALRRFKSDPIAEGKLKQKEQVLAILWNEEIEY